MAQGGSWGRFQDLYFFDRRAKFGLDISRMNFDARFFPSMAGRINEAFRAMESLERGELANPDEKRTVGHYWLRNPEITPDPTLRSEIEETLGKIKNFSRAVHDGKISPVSGGKFRHLLLIGIGGSALGPQFVTQALGSPHDPMSIFFLDNTDPDGMEHVFRKIPDLSKTLCVVISKSGGTKETRNGQLVAARAWTVAGLPYAKSFVAVTCPGSALDQISVQEKWLERFPMWDWVGGRTSELSAVGLLPAALQGFDIDNMLRGAREMDNLTRRPEVQSNPAALLALMWHHAGAGRGQKDMVVLPYKDRLELFSRYLQQLVMESLGKELDLHGKPCNQGIAVYGNKGSTDQHAYVQQLRDGLNNFFVVFIEVLRDRSLLSSGDFAVDTFEVEPGITSGDYLSGFLQGTRQALHEKGRESVTLTIDEVSAYSVGQLIALFERAVGLYASLVNVNAYHQPGVEAGKKAAAEVLELQRKVISFLLNQKEPLSAGEIASAVGELERTENVFHILRHLARNSRLRVAEGETLFGDRYSV